jgi:hypothetical protein
MGKREDRVAFDVPNQQCNSAYLNPSPISAPRTLGLLVDVPFNFTKFQAH